MEATTKNMKIIGITGDQEEAIRIFINMNDWNLQIEMEDNQVPEPEIQAQEPQYSITADGCQPSSDRSEAYNILVAETESVNYVDLFHVDDQPKCPYCFLQPCVITHRQGWLQPARPPREGNNKTRKKMYRKF